MAEAKAILVSLTLLFSSEVKATWFKLKKESLYALWSLIWPPPALGAGKLSYRWRVFLLGGILREGVALFPTEGTFSACTLRGEQESWPSITSARRKKLEFL